MRVLVTGAGGQLGRDVVLACGGAGDDVVACTHAELDVTDRDAVLGAVLSVRPHAVIHAAAWTAVDDCEADLERAYASNALAVRWVAEACRRADAHLVHLSTDYVFSGAKSGPYVEWDEPDPLSAYGRSKLAGEREAGPEATIVRTSWVCGEHGANMVKTILRLAGEHDQLTFVDDQRGHPTFTADLAPMLRRLALDRRAGHPPRDEPGRGVVVRVRPSGDGGRRGSIRPASRRSRPPSCNRPAPPLGRPTPCSTTPCCG